MILLKIENILWNEDMINMFLFIDIPCLIPGIIQNVYIIFLKTTSISFDYCREYLVVSLKLTDNTAYNLKQNAVIQKIRVVTISVVIIMSTQLFVVARTCRTQNKCVEVKFDPVLVINIGTYGLSLRTLANEIF